MRPVALPIALAFALGASTAHAVLPDEQLADSALEARARALSKELRCVVCQNQSIDDSDAPLARDLRTVLRERLQAGDSDAEARDYIVQRYGNFVLLKPPVEAATLPLWLGPAALLIVGGVRAALMLSKRRLLPETEPLTDAEAQAADRLIADDR